MKSLTQKAESFYKDLANKGHEIKQLVKPIPEIDLKEGAIFTKKPDSELKYLEKKVYESVGNNPDMAISFVKGDKPLYILPARVVEEKPNLFVQYKFNQK